MKPERRSVYVTFQLLDDLETFRIWCRRVTEDVAGRGAETGSRWRGAAHVSTWRRGARLWEPVLYDVSSLVLYFYSKWNSDPFNKPSMRVFSRPIWSKSNDFVTSRGQYFSSRPTLKSLKWNVFIINVWISILFIGGVQDVSYCSLFSMYVATTNHTCVSWILDQDWLLNWLWCHKLCWQALPL